MPYPPLLCPLGGVEGQSKRMATWRGPCPRHGPSSAKWEHAPPVPPWPFSFTLTMARGGVWTGSYGSSRAEGSPCKAALGRRDNGRIAYLEKAEGGTTGPLLARIWRVHATGGGVTKAVMVPKRVGPRCRHHRGGPLALALPNKISQVSGPHLQQGRMSCHVMDAPSYLPTRSMAHDEQSQRRVGRTPRRQRRTGTVQQMESVPHPQRQPLHTTASASPWSTAHRLSIPDCRHKR